MSASVLSRLTAILKCVETALLTATIARIMHLLVKQVNNAQHAALGMRLFQFVTYIPSM